MSFLIKCGNCTEYNPLCYSCMKVYEDQPTKPENYKSTIEKLISECIEEIGRLKSTKAHVDLVAKHYFDTQKRLDELEKHMQEMRGMCLHPTKPHKCPVCHGNGIVWDITNEQGLPWPNSSKIECKSCQGKGIVWG